MILEDHQLGSIVWITPSKFGYYRVFVGDLLVMRSHDLDKAEKAVKELRDAAIRGVKEKIAEMTSNLCERCSKEMPKKRKTKLGISLLHYDQSLGWQPCQADFIWLALMRDTLERKGEVEV